MPSNDDRALIPISKSKELARDLLALADAIDKGSVELARGLARDLAYSGALAIACADALIDPATGRPRERRSDEESRTADFVGAAQDAVDAATNRTAGAGAVLALRHLAELLAADAAGDARAPDSEPRHSSDFTSVVWYGTHYAFSKGNQAESVRLLWIAWERGTPTLSQGTIGSRIGSNAEPFRLAHVFRDHPAWGTMIRSPGKGVFELRAPDAPTP